MSTLSEILLFWPVENQCNAAMLHDNGVFEELFIMALKWNVDKELENTKLAPKEDDWKLAGHGETITGRRQPKRRKFFGDSSFDESY